MPGQYRCHLYTELTGMFGEESEGRLLSGQHKHFLILNEFPRCSHSDTNLVELEKETIKEDDRAVLLEGGLARSASVRLHSSSIKTNLIRSLPVICKTVMDLHVIIVLKTLFKKYFLPSRILLLGL